MGNLTAYIVRFGNNQFGCEHLPLMSHDVNGHELPRGQDDPYLGQFLWPVSSFQD